ncbi:uncharacterized protein HLK63_L14421 [Nakaseomyces glabratus]|nr:hypothetical protein LTX96_0003876 [Nakaseomyces glabratus]UCS23214.1 uncharacterized protein GW608_L14421 [Nakaseomyces glabratus]UCS28446.1 uncharacterized protein HLK63_L14421 [Nakaseomyces glabratus]UCS33675.1 uncharacterized protein HLK64_L14421 [Nakaseomyces glabratus]UCS38904.1 uncharacterized protein HLK62_L14421 [Nakaseomyces glabratus]
METIKRRRGRPQLTKDYADPSQSPLAQSSKQVQKQGKRAFAKPLMKVISTPSPKKRRMSTDLNSPPVSITKKGRHRGIIISSPMKKTAAKSYKENRYEDGFSSGSSTPTSTPTSHSSFFSVSRNTLQSSPPMMFSSSPTVSSHNMKQPQPRMYYSHSTQDETKSRMGLKLALTVNEKGEAVICEGGETLRPAVGDMSTDKDMASTSMDSSQTDRSDKASATELETTASNTAVPDTSPMFNKREVLSMLKKMNFNNNNDKPNTDTLPRLIIDDEITGPSANVICEDLDGQDTASSAHQHQKSSSNGQVPKSPCTPGTTFQFKTGFTPKFGIDSMLADEFSSPKFAKRLASHENHLSINISSPEHNLTLTPRTRKSLRSVDGVPFTQFMVSNSQTSQDKSLGRTPITSADPNEQQFVFKFSSGDPLLLTEDGDGNWPDILYHQFSTSPRKTKAFNTPPSWINFGSPGPLSPLRRNSNTLLTTNLMKTLASPNVSNERGASSSLNPSIEVHSPIVHENLSSVRTRKDNADFSASKMNIPSSPRNLTISNEPATPKNLTETISNTIECTPLIQHTMEGSLSTKYLAANFAFGQIDHVVAIDTAKQTSVIPKQDDARLALQKLINDH